MPTYEYACKSCGHHLEVHQSFSEDPLTTCLDCAGELRKVFAPVGIVLKGSGFYKTDSRSSNGRSASKERSDGSEGTEKKEKTSNGSTDATSSETSTSSPGPEKKGGGNSDGSSSGSSSSAAEKKPAKKAASS